MYCKKMIAVFMNLCFVTVVAAGCSGMLDVPNSGNAPIENTPVPGGEITFAGTDDSSTTITFGSATDVETDQSLLEYKVVISTTQDALDTVPEANALSGEGLLRDWTTSTTPLDITGLNTGATYWIAVLVKDRDGNITLYTPRSVVITSAPVAGTPLSFADTGTTSTSVSWGEATDGQTAQALLEYKLVFSSSQSAIDTIAEVDTMLGPLVLSDWSAYTNPEVVTGLTPGATYWFAVLVRDADNELALYTPSQVTMQTPPVPGTAISFSGTDATSTTVSFGQGTDVETAQGNLQYKLVVASSQAALDTVAEADALTGGSIVTDWASYSNSSPHTVTGLTPGSTCWFAVLVRDGDGDTVLYAPQSVTILNIPVPGSTITFSGTDDTSTTISFGQATDIETLQANLQYKIVVASTQGALDTLAEADALTGASIISDWSTFAGIIPFTVTGLTPGATYWFAVLVKDADNVKALYQPKVIALQSAPLIGSAITFADTGTTSTSVSWGEATDGQTAQTLLEYKLVFSSSQSAIDTVAEVDTMVGPLVLGDWSAYANPEVVTGLTPGATYWFAVLVRDADNELALYAPSQVTMHNPPVPGTLISFTGTDESSTTVSFGQGTDVETAQGNLQYKLVFAASQAALDSIAEADALTGLSIISGWGSYASVSPHTLTGLTPGATCWFAVLVRDGHGDIALYTPKSVSLLNIPAPGTGITFADTDDTSTTISFGQATDIETLQANLQYKIVVASTQGALDTVAEADALTGGSIISGWSSYASASPYAVTGLTPGTTCWFAVLVKDADNDTALYTPHSVTLLNIPVPGSAISFADTDDTSTTISFGEATDVETSQANLQYKIVTASAEDELDTIEEADALTGTSLVRNWDTDANPEIVTGLFPGTTYWFAVLVRDADTYMALYAPRSVTCANIPVVGTGITFSGTDATSTTVSFGPADDVETAQANLRYKIVIASSQAALDTIAEADALSGGSIVRDWATNAGSAQVTGLTAETTYWIAVLVKDEEGFMSLYPPTSVTTTVDTSDPAIASFSQTGANSLRIVFTKNMEETGARAIGNYKLVLGKTLTGLASDNTNFTGATAAIAVSAITGSGTTYDLTFTAGFASDSWYTLVLDRGEATSGYLQDTTNKALDTDNSRTFFNDTTGPYIISVSGEACNTSAVLWIETSEEVGNLVASDTLTSGSGTQFEIKNQEATSGCTVPNPSTTITASKNAGSPKEITVNVNSVLCSGEFYKLRMKNPNDDGTYCNGQPCIQDSAGNTATSPAFFTFQVNRKLIVQSVKSIDTTTVDITFNKPVQESSVNCSTTTACNKIYRISGLGDITSAARQSSSRVVRLTHGTAQVGRYYTVVVANGVTSDDPVGWTEGGNSVLSASTCTGGESLSGYPFDRFAFLGSGVSIESVDDFYFDDPFQDGAKFVFAFSYKDQVYIGPNDRNKVTFRFEPNGLNPSLADFMPTGTCSTPHGFGYIKAGYTIYNTNQVLCNAATGNSGPESEVGVVGFNSVQLTISSTLYELLLVGTLKPNVSHLYYTGDSDNLLNFKQVAITGANGTNTASIQSIVGQKDFVFIGIPSDHGTNAPVFNRYTATADGNGVITLSVARDMAGNYISYLGKANTGNGNNNGGGVVGIDSMMFLNDYMYLANNGGVVYLGSNTIRGDTKGWDGTPTSNDTKTIYTLCSPATFNTANNMTLWTTDKTDAVGTRDDAGGLGKTRPGEKGIPIMKEHDSKIYLVRNVSIAGNTVDGQSYIDTVNTRKTGSPTYRNGMENYYGELWVCNPAGGANNTAFCEADDWTKLVSGTETELGGATPAAFAISMLEFVGDQVYIGFDDPTNGVRIYTRALSGLGATSGTMASAGWTQAGTSGLGAAYRNKYIFSSSSTTDAYGDSYLFVNVADDSAYAIRVYKQLGAYVSL